LELALLTTGRTVAQVPALVVDPVALSLVLV
jgi:hypothetical protein